MRVKYFPVVLSQCIMLYEVILAFDSVDEILMRNLLNENFFAVLSCVAVYYAS